MRAMDAEQLARKLHEAYERLAPDFGYETRRESAVPWESVPEQNKALMIAVAAEVLSSEHSWAERHGVSGHDRHRDMGTMR